MRLKYDQVFFHIRKSDINAYTRTKNDLEDFENLNLYKVRRVPNTYLHYDNNNN